MVRIEGGGAEYLAVWKTRKLLIFRDAQNAENGQIPPNWNVRFFICQAKSAYRFIVCFRLGDHPLSTRHGGLARLEKHAIGTVKIQHENDSQN